MEVFTAAILSDNNKGKVLFFAGAALLVMAAIALMGAGIIPAGFSALSVLVFVIMAARYFLQTRKQVLKKISGELRITGETICINDMVFQLRNVQEIRLWISGWKSYQRSSERSTPIEKMHAGDNNYLEVVTPKGRRQYEIQLNSKEHWALLREHVIAWYRAGYIVSEKVNGSRSYGLQVLHYSEIQQFKKLISNTPSGS